MEHPSSLIPAVWYNYSSYNDLLNRSRQLQQPAPQTPQHAPSLTTMTSMSSMNPMPQMMVSQPARSPVPDVSLQMAEAQPKPVKVRKRVNYEGMPRNFHCVQCPSSFHTQAKLNSHNRIHTGIKPYACDVCGKAFIQGSNLRAHKRIHTGERPYKCDECGKSFRGNSYLVVHKRIHSGEKPYICGYCGKGFVMSTYLANHIREHTGEQPFACEYCGETFSQSLDRRMHRKIHTGEKSVFKCRECNITFVKPKDYRKHKKEVHLGYKPFKCQLCDRGFSNQKFVARHELKCKGPKTKKAKGRPRKHPRKEGEEAKPRVSKRKRKPLPPPSDRVFRTRTRTIKDEIKEEPETEVPSEISNQHREGIDINEIVKELGIEGFTKESLEEIPKEVIQSIPKESITQELLKDLIEKRDQQRYISMDNLSDSQVNTSTKPPMVTIHQQEPDQSPQHMLSPSEASNHQVYSQNQQIISDQQVFVHQSLHPQVISSNEQMITIQQNPPMTVHQQIQHITEPAAQLAYDRHQPYAVDLSNITTTQFSRT